MKECYILVGSKHTLTQPTYFQGVRTPQLSGSRPVATVTGLRFTAARCARDSRSSHA